MPNEIALSDFLTIAKVKEATVRRNRDRIPGLAYKDGKYFITPGTRYPCDLHRYRLKNSADRRYVLLKMISEYKYISHLDLQVYHEQFVALLSELLEAGLIQENHMDNHYGANAYDCTSKGDAMLRKEKLTAIKEIAEMVASVSGALVGRVLSEVAA